jgi:hypothetical protein
MALPDGFPAVPLTPEEEEDVDLYERYDVMLHIRERITGGVPANPELLSGFLRGKGISSEQAQAELAAKMASDMDATLTEEIESKTSVFYRSGGTGGPLCTKEFAIKACLKEAGVASGYMSAGGIRQPMQHGVFIKPLHILLRREDGSFYLKADGTDEKVTHTMGPRGPVSGISRFEYVRAPYLRFEIWVRASYKQKPTEQQLHIMLRTAKEIGLGANRTMSEGKFDLLHFAALA